MNSNEKIRELADKCGLSAEMHLERVSFTCVLGPPVWHLWHRYLEPYFQEEEWDFVGSLRFENGVPHLTPASTYGDWLFQNFKQELEKMIEKERAEDGDG